MRGRQKGTRESSVRNPALQARIFFTAAAVLVLASCGDLSLLGTLNNESPGEFRLSPETVNLQVGKEFAFTAAGGFTPYNYEIVSGLGGFGKEQTWVYKSPDDIGSADYIVVTIQATDQLGNSDTATVRVFKPFSIVGDTAVTMQLPGRVTIQAAGGVAPYNWAVDGTADPFGTNPYAYTPTTEGTHVVSVTDEIDNYKEVTVTVLPANPPLTIAPVAAGVQVGGTVSFAAFGGKPPYSWTPMANVSPTTGTPVTYSASAVGTDTVTLADSLGASVTATVTVTAAPIPPLVLSPDAPMVTAVGDTVQFNATGGVPPYRYYSEPAGHGSIDPDTGLYKQRKAGPKDVWVWVQDSVGNKDITIVYWAGP